MERIDSLTNILRREIADYDGPALGATTYYFENPAKLQFAVVIVPDYEYPRKSRAHVVVIAHIVGDAVVIDEDTTDRPLYEELIRAGIPREKIVLLYAGEKPPQSN